MKKIRNKVGVKKLKNLEYSGIGRILEKDILDSFDIAIGVKEEIMVTIKVRINKNDIPSDMLTFKCGKIGTNWKIININFM